MRSREEILYPATSEPRPRRRREEVLLAIWNGKATKEIAADLGLSPKTVEYHRKQLYRVFAVSDPVSLCRRAMVVGLIQPDVCGVKGPKGQRGHKGPERTAPVAN